MQSTIPSLWKQRKHGPVDHVKIRAVTYPGTSERCPCSLLSAAEKQEGVKYVKNSEERHSWMCTDFQQSTWPRTSLTPGAAVLFAFLFYSSWLCII